MSLQFLSRHVGGVVKQSFEKSDKLDIARVFVAMKLYQAGVSLLEGDPSSFVCFIKRTRPLNYLIMAYKPPRKLWNGDNSQRLVGPWQTMSFWSHRQREP
jgi:hypothetical protein